MDKNAIICFDEGASERILGHMADVFAELENVFGELMGLRREFAPSWRGQTLRSFERRVEGFAEWLGDLKSKWNDSKARYEHARNCVAKLNEIDFGVQR